MAKHEHLLLVTGLSGAGKSEAMKALEDLGFFCIDNLPPAFLPQLTGLQALAVHHSHRIAVAKSRRLTVFQSTPYIQLPRQVQ